VPVRGALRVGPDRGFERESRIVHFKRLVTNEIIMPLANERCLIASILHTSVIRRIQSLQRLTACDLRTTSY